MYEKKASKVF